MPANTGQTTAAPARVNVAFAAIVLAMLPAVLDQTILATALPTIAGDLGSLSEVSWVVTAYVIAAAATTPLWGKVGDRYGRKFPLQLALTVFVSASMLCGFAQNITELVLVRSVQGVAAGGLMTLSMAAVGDLVTPRQRGRYQGYIAATFAVATIAGPLIGGVLTEDASWRWVFFVNLPLGLAALVGLGRTLPRPEVERPEHALDVLGAALLAGATTALMLISIWGGDRYAWGSGPILALFVAMIALTTSLIARTRTVADPIVPLRMLRMRPVALPSAAMFMGTAALFSITVFVPLYLQTTTGASASEAGLLLMPMMLGIVVSTTVAGRRIAATGRYKRFPLAGLALMTVALAAFAATADSPSRVSVGALLVVFGLGFGMVTQVLVVVVQNSVDRREIGVATSVAGFFRALGGAIGAAVLGAVFAANAGAGAADVTAGVEAVFIAAAPLAALGLVAVAFLREPASDSSGARSSAGSSPARAATG